MENTRTVMKEVEELESLGLCSALTRAVASKMEEVCQQLYLEEAESYFDHRVHWKRVRLLGEYKLLGLGIPEAYGGIGGSNLDTALAFVSLGSNLGMSAASFMNVQNGLVAKTILRWGNEEQKKRFLPDLISAKRIGAFCLTEPEAGSDPSSLKTAWRPGQSSGLVINGTKYLITNGDIADLFIVFAYPKGRTDTLSVFILERKGNEDKISDPVLTYRGIEAGLSHKVGLHASDTAMIEFKDAFVPTENVLVFDRGKHVYNHAFLSGRLGIAAGCTGVILDCLNGAIERAKHRVQHGKQIARHQLVQAHISAIAEDFEKARWPTYSAAILKDKYDSSPQDNELRKEVDYRIAIAKKIAANAACDASDRAVQVGGGFGYSTLYGPARHFKDVRVARIYEGSDEILTLKIAYHLLGKGFDAFS